MGYIFQPIDFQGVCSFFFASLQLKNATMVTGAKGAPGGTALGDVGSR